MFKVHWIKRNFNMTRLLKNVSCFPAEAWVPLIYFGMPSSAAKEKNMVFLDEIINLDSDMMFSFFNAQANLKHWKIHVPEVEVFRSLLIDQKQLCPNVQYFRWPGVSVLMVPWIKKTLGARSSFLQAACQPLYKELRYVFWWC